MTRPGMLREMEFPSADDLRAQRAASVQNEESKRAQAATAAQRRADELGEVISAFVDRARELGVRPQPVKGPEPTQSNESVIVVANVYALPSPVFVMPEGAEYEIWTVRDRKRLIRG